MISFQEVLIKSLSDPYQDCSTYFLPCLCFVFFFVYLFRLRFELSSTCLVLAYCEFFGHIYSLITLHRFTHFSRHPFLRYLFSYPFLPIPISPDIHFSDISSVTNFSRYLDLHISSDISIYPFLPISRFTHFSLYLSFLQ